MLKPFALFKQSLENKSFSFATLDIKLADNISGIEVGKILTQKGIPFVFISAFSNPENLYLAKELKPLGIFELLDIQNKLNLV